MPARVFRRLATLRGSGDDEGESSGLAAVQNRGSRGVRAAHGAEEAVVRTIEPSTRSGGVRSISKPGGRNADEDEGARKSRTLRAPSLVDAAENGAREIRAGGEQRPDESSSTGWQLPVEVGEEGHTAVGDEAGSGVARAVAVSAIVLATAATLAAIVAALAPGQAAPDGITPAAGVPAPTHIAVVPVAIVVAIVAARATVRAPITTRDALSAVALLPLTVDKAVAPVMLLGERVRRAIRNREVLDDVEVDQRPPLEALAATLWHPRNT
jgi:hypothetical protein